MADESIEKPEEEVTQQADAAQAETTGDGPVDMPELDSEGGSPVKSLDPTDAVELLGDVDLDVKIELGRCRMQVGDVLRLQEGSVVELDKLAGDPVDVYVNERLVARGEVLVVNDNFCVRVNEVLAAEADNS